jgi:hypothetical protein
MDLLYVTLKKGMDYSPLFRYRSATDYMDEADIFYESPTKFITKKVLPSSSRTAPAYVVVFDSLLQMPSQANHGSKTIGDLLRNQGEYTEVCKLRDASDIWHVV